MEALPDSSILEVLLYLPFPELTLTISTLSKYHYQLLQDPYAQQLLLARDLQIPVAYDMPPHQCKYLLMAVHRQQARRPVKFTGFATSGGVDDDETKFWMKDLFMVDRHSTYCCREEVLNVNVAGVLMASQPKKGSRKAALSEVKDRLNLIRDRLSQTGLDLDEIIDNEVKLEYLGMRLFTQIVQMQPAILLKEGEDHEEAREILQNVISTLLPPEPPQLQGMMRYPNNHRILTLPFEQTDFSTTEKLGIISQLNISRKGGFTCPVKNLLIFCSLDFIDIESQDFNIYDNLKSLLEVQALVDSDPTLPRVHQVFTSTACHYCEFQGRAELKLRPIAWVGFQECEESERMEEVTLKLRQKFSALYIYVKLVDQEDRKSVIGWNHSWMNIDIKHVGAEGFVLRLNPN